MFADESEKGSAYARMKRYQQFNIWKPEGAHWPLLSDKLDHSRYLPPLSFMTHEERVMAAKIKLTWDREDLIKVTNERITLDKEQSTLLRELLAACGPADLQAYANFLMSRGPLPRRLHQLSGVLLPSLMRVNSGLAAPAPQPTESPQVNESPEQRITPPPSRNEDGFMRVAAQLQAYREGSVRVAPQARPDPTPTIPVFIDERLRLFYETYNHSGNNGRMP